MCARAASPARLSGRARSPLTASDSACSAPPPCAVSPTSTSPPTASNERSRQPGQPFAPDTNRAHRTVSVCQQRARWMRSAVLHLVMRDEHRPKQELVHEMTGLRKQVLDLKDAMTARRRVEDALRAAMALLHTLIDNAPAGLCLFRRDGTLLTAN